jgi:hypothetical protein
MVDNMVFIPIPTIADELLGNIKPTPLPSNVRTIINLTKEGEREEDKWFRRDYRRQRINGKRR